MTRNSQSVDDAAIEQLVRDVAAGWSMPAVRLDAPSWRDRVRSPRARRVGAPRGRLATAGRATMGAIALTIAGALVAVLLTRPLAGPGKSAAPTSRGVAPGPTSAAAGLLPKLLVNREGPPPSNVLVGLEEGDVALVDLATGTRTAPLTGAAYGSAVLPNANGSFICLCVRTSDDVSGMPTRADIALQRYDASGALLASTSVQTLEGAPDPRDGTLPERPPHLTFDLRFSPDGRYGLLGWSVRKHPAWQSGAKVIDLSSGAVVSSIDLPDDTTGIGETRRVVTAPRVFATAAGSAVVIAREWYSWSPPASDGQSFEQGTDTVEATLADGVLGSVAPLSAAVGCGQRVISGGPLPGGGVWLACVQTFRSQVVIRRVDQAGSILDDATLATTLDVDGNLVATAPDGGAVFAWNPLTASLDRIDLRTGESSEGHGAVASAGRGPLTAVGDWLAPAAAAKSFLYGGVVVSPDGARVYAAGIAGIGNDAAVSGSSGVFVFDGATATSVARWDPIADHISLAVSRDGRFVYATGMPRVDAAGKPQPAQQASITVYGAADGAVALIAGELGGAFLTFPEAMLP